MLMIFSLTLLISILPLFVAAHLDPRSSFVTVPLVQHSNLTLPNGAFNIKAARRSILAARSMNRKNAMNFERRLFTELLVNHMPKLRNKFKFIDRLIPIKGQLKLTPSIGDPLIGYAPYTGQITIGTPPQTIFVVFSTAASITRVCLVDSVHDPQALGQYKENNIFIPSESNTYDGQGTDFTDVVTFADIKVKGQKFRSIQHTKDEYLDKSHPHVGTIALGFMSGAPSTFMDNAVLQRQIKENVFGISFAPGNLEIHFGGTNEHLYTNPIEYHMVIQGQRYWILGNAQIYVGDEKKPFLEKLQTIIATDSLFTWGPRHQVDRFYSKLIPTARKVVREGFEGLYEFTCDTKPKVELSWGNDKERYRWEYLDFVIQANRSKNGKLMCYGSIAAYDPGTKQEAKVKSVKGGDEEMWEIGTSFLSTLYAGFFNTGGKPKIMFGKLKQK